jgi:hypothetical protein
MHAASGKLELTKRKILIFAWKYDNDGTAIPDNQYNYPIHIIDSATNHPMQVEAIDMATPYKLLGIPITFNGESREQEKQLISKCDQLIQIATQLPLDRQDMYTYHSAIILSRLRYMLQASFISWKILTAQSNRLHYTILPKLGFNKHFPRAIVTAPAFFGGLELVDLYTGAGLAQIKLLLQHIRAVSSLGKAIIQALECYRLHSGIFQSPLE